jgi:hypothetical protein
VIHPSISLVGITTARSSVVGISVGMSVGIAVGMSVGMAVGISVGIAVPPSSGHTPENQDHSIIIFTAVNLHGPKSNSQLTDWASTGRDFGFTAPGLEEVVCLSSTAHGNLQR